MSNTVNRWRRFWQGQHFKETTNGVRSQVT